MKWCVDTTALKYFVVTNVPELPTHSAVCIFLFVIYEIYFIW